MLQAAVCISNALQGAGQKKSHWPQEKGVGQGSTIEKAAGRCVTHINAGEEQRTATLV